MADIFLQGVFENIELLCIFAGRISPKGEENNTLYMKRILIAMTMVALGMGQLMAQKETPLNEKDVDVNTVKDFQHQQAGATHVAWWKTGDDIYKVTYIDAEGSRQAMLFSPRGTETLYYVDAQYCPHSVRDTVVSLYPGYAIDQVWVRKVRGKYTYQVRVAVKSGFLWWRKETDAKLLNFEVDGKFINESTL